MNTKNDAAGDLALFGFGVERAKDEEAPESPWAHLDTIFDGLHMQEPTDGVVTDLPPLAARVDPRAIGVYEVILSDNSTISATPEHLDRMVPGWRAVVGVLPPIRRRREGDLVTIPWDLAVPKEYVWTSKGRHPRKDRGLPKGVTVRIVQVMYSESGWGHWQWFLLQDDFGYKFSVPVERLLKEE